MQKYPSADSTRQQPGVGVRRYQLVLMTITTQLTTAMTMLTSLLCGCIMQIICDSFDSDLGKDSNPANFLLPSPDDHEDRRVPCLQKVPSISDLSEESLGEYAACPFVCLSRLFASLTVRLGPVGRESG